MPYVLPDPIDSPSKSFDLAHRKGSVLFACVHRDSFCARGKCSGEPTVIQATDIGCLKYYFSYIMFSGSALNGERDDVRPHAMPY
uniref:Uncharacterized protein n=1 Tax=mine drainage metagenome TaxID=410659 RepID=E6Q0S9_9ZZZZ